METAASQCLSPFPLRSTTTSAWRRTSVHPGRTSPHGLYARTHTHIHTHTRTHTHTRAPKQAPTPTHTHTHTHKHIHTRTHTRNHTRANRHILVTLRLKSSLLSKKNALFMNCRLFFSNYDFLKHGNSSTQGTQRCLFLTISSVKKHGIMLGLKRAIYIIWWLLLFIISNIVLNPWEQGQPPSGCHVTFNTDHCASYDLDIAIY